MKVKTWEQVETAKLRAENFVRNILGDDERADEIAAESVEDYAARKRFVIKNPSPKLVAISLRSGQMATKEELQQELKDAYDRIDALENYIAQGQDLLPADDSDEDDDDSSEEEEDEDTDAE